MIYTAIAGGGSLDDGGTLDVTEVIGGTEPITYLWTQIGGETVTIVDPTSPNATFNPIEPGTYEFQLTATDANGLSTTSTLEIIISPNAVVLDITAEGTGEIGNGTLTATEPTNGVAPYTYLWTQTGGTTVAIVNADSKDATFAPWEAGTYEFTVTATDADGNEGSYSVTIVITCCDVITDAIDQLGAGTLSVDSDGNVITI